ncbi:MAG: M48 family metalloprotease [Cyclobacteriaceae bacterium]|nr:M48 family metalloprotease [Cyclobacteriaceae bacterium]
MNPDLYPPTPTGVDPLLTAPGEQFKKEVVRVTASIALFVVVYLVLMVAAIALAVFAGYAGISIIALKPSLITLLIGLGLLGLGVMVLYFLVKFMFATVKTDRSQWREVKIGDQPQLFAFIRQLTTDVGAPFPKRIYFSSDVNASVFYDSSFWSMFLPVKKNLLIGLGLVNAMNVSEFKAVLAHEFGHFSQRSMKLGSFVYNVNRVIYNLLYDNQGYSKVLEKWGNISGVFAFFANLTVWIVRAVQHILQAMYGMINRSHMSLSQQMEFHADAVAASVAGGNQLASALRRLELAGTSQEQLFGVYQNWVGKQLKARNMFPDHRAMMLHIATELNIPVDKGLPVIDEQMYNRLANTRVTYKDQWASHPRTEERTERLRQLGIETPTDDTPAWHLMQQPEQIQLEWTEAIYSGATFAGEPTVVHEGEFPNRFVAEVNRYSFDPAYKGYFDFRPPVPVDFNNPPSTQAKFLEEILTTAMIANLRKLTTVNNDLQTLEMIRSNSTIRTFEFAGNKYQRTGIVGVVEELTKEKEELDQSIRRTDLEIVAWGFQTARAHGQADEYARRYQLWCDKASITEQTDKQVAEIGTALQPVFERAINEIEAQELERFLTVKQDTVKSSLRTVLDRQQAHPSLLPEEQHRIEAFLKETHVFYSKFTGLKEESITLLMDCLGLWQRLVAEDTFYAKKDVLDWQVGVVGGGVESGK